jgi:DNA-binding PadR family transcriptional regulator
MRTMGKIPSLGYAILGLIQQKPCSGYDVRKIFSGTAMKSYSDSPGAIYPALGRLEKQGMIRGRIQQGAGLRRRQVFSVTAKGSTELRRWISQPVTRDDVDGGLKEVMLRFAFSEPVSGADASIQLLSALRAQLEEYVPGLRLQLEAGKAVMPRSGRLALESGIRSFECLLEWTKYALTNYAGKE